MSKLWFLCVSWPAIHAGTVVSPPPAQLQVPIGGQHRNAASCKPQIYSVPIDSWNGVLHTIGITVGTPPQNFNASLDLTSNAFFVPSSDCKSRAFCGEKHLYNSTASSTYTANGSIATAEHWNIYYKGHLSQDTVRVAGIEIAQQTFEEYEDARMNWGGGIREGFDGLLGLAPWELQQTPEHQQYSNYLALLKEREKIDKNVFSLKLPRTLDEQGELVFGGSNPQSHTAAFRDIALMADESVPPRWRGAWNLPLSSITLNTSIPIHLPMPNHIATLSSMPMFVLPTAFARNFSTIIGAEPFNWFFDSIPCDRRPYLPELTFQIGGENFTIDAYDYTFEWTEGLFWGTACLVWITEAEDTGVGKDVVVLGSGFLKRWYTRWDIDERKVGFAELKKSK